MFINCLTRIVYVLKILFLDEGKKIKKVEQLSTGKEKELSAGTTSENFFLFFFYTKFGVRVEVTKMESL